MGRSVPTVAAEMLAGWLPSRMAGPVVVVAGPVVVDAMVVVVDAALLVVDATVVDGTLLVGATVVVFGPVVGGVLVVVATLLVVVTSVVVGAAVVGTAVVVGPTVVGAGVSVACAVAPRVEGAVPVVVLPTAASAGVVAGRGVVVAALTALGPGPGVVDGGGAVAGPRVAGMVVDVGVGAGVVGKVGIATSGIRRGGWGSGSRVAEATRAARTAVATPKVNSRSFQGRRGLARCRGGGVGMVHRPGSAGSSDSKTVPGSRPLSCTEDVGRHSRSNGAFLPATEARYAGVNSPSRRLNR
jgi:hypothetical protein